MGLLALALKATQHGKSFLNFRVGWGRYPESTVTIIARVTTSKHADAKRLGGIAINLITSNL
jgi:hypothetical protein